LPPEQQVGSSNLSGRTSSLPSAASRLIDKAHRSFLSAIALIPATEERIAVFDNDGTLWIEQPMYFQLAFIIDRVNALAPQHPEWGDKQPFKALLDGDLETVFAGGQ
jgi:hypothetical protein